MAAPLTFAALKAAILNNTKRLEVCPAYQAALLATDYQELITAGIDLIAWSYQAGVVDDYLITEFPESTLNANSIYTTGTFTLTNPANTIYIAKDATVLINLTGTAKADIYSMGNCTITVNASDSAYCDLKCYNAAVAVINLSGDATFKLHCREVTNTTVQAQNKSVAHISMNGQSNLTYTGNDSAFALLSAYMQATVTMVLNDTAEAETRTYNKARIINNVLPV